MDSGNYVIAIDGLAGSGKSTMAKLLADRLKIGYIDSGALYRAVTAFAIDNNLDIEDEQLISKIASNLEIRLDGDQIFVNGIDFKKRIRSLDVNQNVSKVATYKGVRETLSNFQRRLAKGRNLVIEGRDIGSDVFPDAKVKFFLIADSDQRAKRRMKDFESNSIAVKIENVVKNLKSRDEIDSLRKHSPLKPSKGSIEIETTNLTIDEVLNKMLKSLVC